MLKVPVERLKWWHRRFTAKPREKLEVPPKIGGDGEWIFPPLTMDELTDEMVEFITAQETLQKWCSYSIPERCRYFH